MSEQKVFSGRGRIINLNIVTSAYEKVFHPAILYHAIRACRSRGHLGADCR
jgi:hypothetical protein